jgi:hypothetical protein
LIPALKIVGAMFLRWDVPEPQEVAADTFGLLARLLAFTRVVTCDDRYWDVYMEALGVWNGLFVKHGEFLDDTPIAAALVEVLLVDLGRAGAPVLAILFLLSNVFAWPCQARLFLRRGPVLEAMFAGFDGLGHAEKENFVIMVCHLLERYPSAVVASFPRLPEFAEVALDCTSAAKTVACPLAFLIALYAMLLAEPATGGWLAELSEGLSEIVATGTPAVAAAAEEVMRQANLYE